MKEIQNLPVTDLSFKSDRFDQGDISALAENIKTYGLQHPVLVAKNKKGYIIVDGRRRFVACKQVGITKLPCIVIEKDDINEDLPLILNTYRLNLSPVELYEQAVRYVKDELKGDPMLLPPDKLKMVAAKLNLDVKTTCRILSIGRLHAAVRELLIAKKIPLRLALLTIKLETDQLRNQFCKMCERDRPSTREALEWIRFHTHGKHESFRRLNSAVFNTKVCAGCRHRGRRDPALFEEMAKGHAEFDEYCWDKKCYDARSEKDWKENEDAAKKQYGFTKIKRLNPDNWHPHHEITQLKRKDPEKCKRCAQVGLVSKYRGTFAVSCPPDCSNIAVVRKEGSSKTKKSFSGKDPSKFTREDKIAYLNDRFPVAIRKVMLEHFFTGKVFKEEKIPKDFVRILFFVGCDALSNPFAAVTHAKDWGNRAEKILAAKALAVLDLNAVAQLNVTAAGNRLRNYDRAGVNAQEIDQAIELLYGTKNWCASHYEVITARLSSRSKKYLKELKSWRPSWANKKRGKKRASN